ncbi:hypothetical protein I3760_10G029100 [Carya illinoinensis]|nr:hypothetical protein I3760_10G029100 [Carya illinoinensis]
MEPNLGTIVRSVSIGPNREETGLESLQFREEIHRLMTVPPENGSSFTELLQLPETQAMELLHSPHSDEVVPVPLSGEPLHGINDDHKSYLPSFNGNLTFPSNKVLIERAAKFSVFASGEHSPETSSVPSDSSANLEKVKSEPAETDSNPNSSQLLVSDPAVNIKNQRSEKRKEREKKGKGCTKKSKIEISQDAEKLPYVHVRARRGQATDSHSLAERARREKINARMKLLQELVPGCSKISGTALVLDEIINHVQSLQRQVELLSMRLATVNPRVDFNLDSLFAPEVSMHNTLSSFISLLTKKIEILFVSSINNLVFLLGGVFHCTLAVQIQIYLAALCFSRNHVPQELLGHHEDDDYLLTNTSGSDCTFYVVVEMGKNRNILIQILHHINTHASS